MLALVAVAAAALTLTPGDAARIERLTGATGQLDPSGSVFKVSVPRTDLTVDVGGVHVTPPMGLTAWAAFTRTPEGAMVMGDLVLTEPQVTPVMDAALAAGLEVTALHNHFEGDEPRILFMHVGGHGSLDGLATGIGRVVTALRQPGPARPRVALEPSQGSLDAAGLAAIVGAKAEVKDGVVRFVVGRSATMHGVELGAAMGVNTWAAFAGSPERAVVDGDVAMREGELQATLRALRANGIEVVAIHQHMAGEEPRYLFLHYWGLGRAEGLARGVRAALEATSGVPVAAAAGGASMDPAKVVFVCEHGNVKSLIARELFNQMAALRGSKLRAVARGLTPGQGVPDVIAGALKGDGFDVSGFEPQRLAAPDTVGAVRVVAIGADTSSTATGTVPVERWEGIPPATEQYAASRDALRARISALLEALEGAR